MTDTIDAKELGQPGSRTRLRGSLGVASIVFIVVAAAAPLGVIGGTAPLGIALGNGSGFALSYLVVTVILLLFAVGFTAATPHVRQAGAFYSYVEKGLGRSAGLAAAFVALVAYVTIEIGQYGLIGPGISAVSTSFGVPEIPWWAGGIVVFGIVTFLAYRNINLSSKILAVLLISELLIVLIFDAFVVFGGHTPEGLSRVIYSPVEFLQGSVAVGLLLAFLSFLGFEATAIFRDEAKDPDRTIPRATYIALLLVGAFYAVSAWALVSAYGDASILQSAQDHPGSLFSDAVHAYVGRVGEHAGLILFVTSEFACILSFRNIASRYFFALGARGVLPTVLGRAHDRHGSPHASSVLTAGLVALAIAVSALLQLDAITQVYTWFAGFAAVGIVVLLVLTSVAVIVLFRRRGEPATSWRTSIAPSLGLVGLIVVLLLVVLNLNTLTGSTVVSAIVIGTLAAAVLAGVLTSRRTRVS
ncbi:APC family permease [Mycobacterium sp. E740]|uniref:APC family permease n=1 Tax=Mycobacterium sp. E740 TaxID=1834149 RepID=UPI000800401E|nr:APC family permease [Mycobacterium sp. E740]OBI72111.1 amino acid transporter [Mycobacterium sp. E740]